MGADGVTRPEGERNPAEGVCFASILEQYNEPIFQIIEIIQ